MKGLIEKYLIKTNLWVSCCFTALLAFFQLSFYELNFYVLGIVFFGTLTIYNFTRIGDLKELFEFNPKIRITALLTYTGLILTMFFVIMRGFELKTFLYLGVLGFVSLCYSLPFSGLGLRAIPFVKLFLISFVWAGSSVGLLLVVHHELFNHKMLFLSVFFFVAGITIPFDIRDQKTDDSKLKTIPMLIGLNKSKLLAIFFLALSSLFFYIEIQEFNQIFFSWIFAIIFSLGGIINTRENNSQFYFSFWMESCSLIPLIAFLIMN